MAACADVPARLHQRGVDLAGVGLRQVDLHGRLPAPSVSCEHLVRLDRTPGARRVLRGLAVLVPVLLDRVEDVPGELDLLVTREEVRVAEEHVEDEPLVRLGARLREGLAVGEVHRDVPDLHGGARNLGAEADRHALVRLDPDDQGVLPQLLGRARLEREVRGPLEDHRDLGHPAAQALAGPQVEGDARPAAVVDLQADGRVGVGLRLGVDAVLFEVPDDLLAALPRRRVLAAHGVLAQVLGQLHGGQHLELLGHQRLGVEGARLLHRRQREQLQQVVLDDVTGRADAVVVGRPGRRCRCPRPW